MVACQGDIINVFLKSKIFVILKALHQEAGLERLYRFTQSNCRIISDSSPTELTDIITKVRKKPKANLF